MRISFERRIFDILNILFMVFMVIITLYPVLYVLFASFSDPIRFWSYSGILYAPLGFTFAAYEKAFSYSAIYRGFLNTLFIVGAGIPISLVLTAIGAYLLSRKNVLLAKPIGMAIVFTMFFSGGLIPFYFTVKGIQFPFPFFSFSDGMLLITIKNVGIYNTLWSLILPSAINTFNMLVMRTGFAAIPDSLSESARIDGAGHVVILFGIMIPLAMPTVAVILLYYGVAYWYAWFNATIFLVDNKLYPLQLVLRQVLITNDLSQMTSGMDVGSQMQVGETLKYAVIVIATLPIVLVYPFLQKYFVSGIMIGAVKG